MPTTAGAPPGSGANFKALSAKLAARGADNPGALAAYIGRRKYGRKGFAKLSAHGRSHGHSNTPWTTIDLADGSPMRCPNCGYNADSAEFDTSGGASGTSVDRQPEALRTAAPGNNASRAGFTAQSVGVGSQSTGLSNGNGRALLMANGKPRQPVRSAQDMMITRSPAGTAVIRHRLGGELIGEVGLGEDNAWRSVIDGQELSPHTHQRHALTELLGVWNRSALDPARPSMPVQAPPRQPDLLTSMGGVNVRAFASDPDGDGDDDDSSTGDTDNDGAGGLTPKGVAIYKKLMARGMSMAAARKMALRAQNMKPGSFSKAG